MNPFVILPGGKRCAVGSRDPCNLSIYIYIYIYIYTYIYTNIKEGYNFLLLYLYFALHVSASSTPRIS